MIDALLWLLAGRSKNSVKRGIMAVKNGGTGEWWPEDEKVES